MRVSRIGWVSVAVVVACGSPPRVEPSPPAHHPAAPAAPGAPSASVTPLPSVVPAAPTAPGGAAPQGQIVDLLQSVATDLAVSSVYRGESQQVGRLADGDLESAWNSRTGDLVGAWIDVRLPAGVTVTSIAMTAGFTRSTDSGDLFTTNHRVTKVRVLRDGSRRRVASTSRRGYTSELTCWFESV